MLAHLQRYFRGAASIRNAFVRPNEGLLAQGNRADVFFQAPHRDRTAPLPEGESWTVLAPLSLMNSDDHQSALNEFGFKAYHRQTLVAAPGGDTVVAYIVVFGGEHEQNAEPEPIPAFNVLDLNKAMPPVADCHLPISDDEVRIKAAEREALADTDAALPGRVGKTRTRHSAYSS